MTDIFDAQLKRELRHSSRPAMKVELYSEDRLDSSGTTTSDCTWFISPSRFPLTSDSSLDIKVDHCSIPHNIYLVSSTNNTIVIAESAQADVTLTLTPGNYTVTELVSHLNTLTTASAVTKTYTWTYVKATDLITLTQTEADLAFDIEAADTSLADILGFERGSTNSAVSHVVTGTKPINFIGIDSIMLWSDIPNTNSYSSRTGTISNILARIPITVPPRHLIEADLASEWSVLLSPGDNLSRVHIKLVDKDGTPVDLQGLNWSISLLVREKFTMGKF